ncbi:16S rRNA (uracil(1498)-N(3))-methyltransferase [Marinobacter sp. X15-166B]|uniref:16S rRNA (uracil(1498)-N(3))-methyltransferase n=1 Tax=Marinobacter sp. X15-166B TaxID=1897620 RepID=UPI00085C041D|nr:16S rRNA (uracil(1498)-N(3))-methyltransferase [Marinobacter sp. X15-166B]OEY65666.1 16S rRNA (uracil(1498)-N(3))-methyltransferase [Marinobacter sp. X15-166B]
MNLAVFSDTDFIGPDRIVLRGRRRDHLARVLKSAPGDCIPVGQLNGLMGEGTLVRLDEQEAELAIALHSPSPAPLPLSLVLAMPRPKMLRRILQTVAALGVKDIWLINAYKVEKSFWQTPWLQVDQLEENLILGLEQAKDTRLPTVHIRQRFKPFVEDELPQLLHERPGLVAHPGTSRACPSHLNQPATLCIGPEGGFIPYEVDKLQAAGCTAVHLGSRILRVETAVPVLIGRLYDSCLG